MSQYAPVLPTDDEDDDEGDFSIVGSTRQPASYQWEQAKRRKLERLERSNPISSCSYSRPLPATATSFIIHRPLSLDRIVPSSTITNAATRPRPSLEQTALGLEIDSDGDSLVSNPSRLGHDPAHRSSGSQQAPGYQQRPPTNQVRSSSSATSSNNASASTTPPTSVSPPHQLSDIAREIAQECYRQSQGDPMYQQQSPAREPPPVLVLRRPAALKRPHPQTFNPSQGPADTQAGPSTPSKRATLVLRRSPRPETHSGHEAREAAPTSGQNRFDEAVMPSSQPVASTSAMGSALVARPRSTSPGSFAPSDDQTPASQSRLPGPNENPRPCSRYSTEKRMPLHHWKLPREIPAGWSTPEASAPGRSQRRSSGQDRSLRSASGSQSPSKTFSFTLADVQAVRGPRTLAEMGLASKTIPRRKSPVDRTIRMPISRPVETAKAVSSQSAPTSTSTPPSSSSQSAPTTARSTSSPRPAASRVVDPLHQKFKLELQLLKMSEEDGGPRVTVTDSTYQAVLPQQAGQPWVPSGRLQWQDHPGKAIKDAFANPTHHDSKIREALTCLHQSGARRYPLDIFFASSVKGWGLRSSSIIAKGSLVLLFTGTAIRAKSALSREKLGNGKYLFWIMGETWAIDARTSGGVARFLNHSCSPNVQCVELDVGATAEETMEDSPSSSSSPLSSQASRDHLKRNVSNDVSYEQFRTQRKSKGREEVRKDFPLLAFYALRDIPAFEELCFDYFAKTRTEQTRQGEGAKRRISVKIGGTVIRDESERQEGGVHTCQCGSRGCRGEEIGQ